LVRIDKLLRPNVLGYLQSDRVISKPDQYSILSGFARLYLDLGLPLLILVHLRTHNWIVTWTQSYK